MKGEHNDGRRSRPPAGGERSSPRLASTLSILILLCAARGLSAPPTWAAAAEDPDALVAEPATRLLHQRWTVAEGLPVNALTDVVQTADGWLWIASFDGLLRFDGVRFTRFDTVAAPALGSNRIVQLLADGDGRSVATRLWILSEQGHLARYGGGRFDAVEASEGDSPRGVQMALDGAGTVWLAAPGGLFRAEDDRLVAAPAALAGQPIHAVGAGAGGRLWLATDDGRLAAVAGGRLRWAGAGMEDHPRHFVQYLAEDEDGVLWIGTDDGLFRWRDGMPEVEPVADLDAPRRSLRAGPLLTPAAAFAGRRRPVVTWEVGRSMRFLQQGPRGALWESTGTALLRDGQEVLALPEGSRPGIRALAFDHEGTAWIATGTRGLQALVPARVTVLGEAEGLAEGNVYPIHQDRDGTVWIGDAAGGRGAVRQGRSGSRRFSVAAIAVESPSTRVRPPEASPIQITPRRSSEIA